MISDNLQRVIDWMKHGCDPLEAVRELELIKPMAAKLESQVDKFEDGIDWIERALKAEAVLDGLKDQEPVAYWDGCHSNPCLSLQFDAPGIGKKGIPLYTTPKLEDDNE